MRITIDEDILSKNNITLDEFMLLYLNLHSINIQTCTETLIKKGLADKNLFSEGALVLSDNTKNLIASIIIDSDKEVINKNAEFDDIANALRELYPKGKKEGTTYMWRSTTAEVARKLKTLVVKYGYTFTKEQAIKATKEYIDSFNGNYKRMRLLKYFILKSEKDADDNINVISEFMSLIENEGQTDTQREDWVSTLV